MKKHEDGNVDPRFKKDMNDLAAFIDGIFNPGLRGTDRKICFTLLITPFHSKGRANYISNGNRSDILDMMREFIKSAEEKPKEGTE